MIITVEPSIIGRLYMLNICYVIATFGKKSPTLLAVASLATTFLK